MKMPYANEDEFVRGQKIKLLVTLVMIFVWLTCGGCVTPLPTGARAHTPTADEIAVWHQIESCAGVTRPISEMTFYELPGVLTFEHKGREVWGYYRPPIQIVMGEDGYFMDPALGHEMLHAILRTVDHPHEFTVECAKLVTPP